MLDWSWRDALSALIGFVAFNKLTVVANVSAADLVNQELALINVKTSQMVFVSPWMKAHMVSMDLFTRLKEIFCNTLCLSLCFVLL